MTRWRTSTERRTPPHRSTSYEASNPACQILNGCSPEPLTPPAELPDAPFASFPPGVAPGIRPKTPLSLACSRTTEALPPIVGNNDDRATPSCARDSVSRTAATFTSRLSAATRRSSPVSTGSWNSVHQSTSTGSATGMLGGFFTASFGPENHDAAVDAVGRVKSGPRVQPVRTVLAINPATRAVLRFALSIITDIQQANLGGRNPAHHRTRRKDRKT